MPDNLPSAVVVVLFGASGDLSARMVLPAFFDLHTRGLLPADWRLVGAGRGDSSDEDFRTSVREALEEFGDGLPEDWDEVSERVRFAGGGFTSEDPGEMIEVIDEVREELGGDPAVVHFLAVPPSAFEPLTRALGDHGLAEDARVVYEKPYGTSLETFVSLEETVKDVLSEDQVFRIDHFLGKEAVQNLYVLRFANELLAGMWNRDHVEQVQIDVPESLDVADRAEFYDETGAALDMLVTHLFQVAAQVAMEPPTDLRDPGSVLAAREDVIASFRALDPDDVVLGQFEGYRDIEGIDDASRTDTFVAARLWVDNDRWRGVPFLLRTGKRMASDAQEVTLVLRDPAGPLAGEIATPNTVRVSIEDAGGTLSIGLTVKQPGPELDLTIGTARLELDQVEGGTTMPPYASLLHDVLLGDRSLFTTASGLRSAFEAFAPLQGDARPEPRPYAQESWGPEEARELAAPYGWVLGQ
ncbi:glucose-6-phosphate dehydrogenase [Georgenia sp. MJ206]|uniref:glucose-6-phosphate dehydrogenase n=1 Tax=Georgenia wangjunii TaxID=3117730 RepID=UPI002F263C8F